MKEKEREAVQAGVKEECICLGRRNTTPEHRRV